MPFDPDADVCLRDLGTTDPDEDRLPIAVGIYRYDGGEPKIRINRSDLDRDGEPCVRRLGGITATEAVRLSRLLKLAADAFDELPAPDTKPKRAGRRRPSSREPEE